VVDRNLDVYYGDNGTIIELKRGDERRLHFPRRKGWGYQIAIEAEYYNRKTGKKHHYGISMGAGGKANYCVSRIHDTVDYEEQLDEAIEHGFQRCAGGVEDRADGDSSGYTPSAWRNWVLVNGKPIKIYLILWRKLRLTDRIIRMTERRRERGELKSYQRYMARPIVFREKKPRTEKVERTMEYKNEKYHLVSHRVNGRIVYKFWRKVPKKKSRKVKRTK